MTKDALNKLIESVVDWSRAYQHALDQGPESEAVACESELKIAKDRLLAALTGSERPEGPGTDLWLVSKDGRPYAAYPREKQAEVYASGFSENVQIEKGTWRSPHEAPPPRAAAGGVLCKKK